MTAVNPDFRYWDSVDPSSFLDHDWENPSREWAATEAINAALKGDGSILEVGPGPGVDYERHFREGVQAGILRYTGVEGSHTLHGALQSRFPEATWQHLPLSALAPLSADVVYARHVLEHQPELEPALSTLLAAARQTVVLTWYRPPGPTAFFEVWQGVHCQTYRRTDVMHSIAVAGFDITARQLFPSGDEGWVLTRC